jgi:hypothetical protein
VTDSTVARWPTMAGSRSPERVPITRPSRGVKPIDVSTDRPFRTAVAEHPLPRCKTTALTLSTGEPASSAHRSITERHEVPWKPYRRMS